MFISFYISLTGTSLTSGVDEQPTSPNVKTSETIFVKDILEIGGTL